MEAYLLDPEQSGLSQHLDGCDVCKARLARMEKEGEDFRRFVLPATLDKVVEANSGYRLRWNSWVMAVPAMAAAAVLAVVALPKIVRQDELGPDPDYIGEKGGMGITVYTTGERGPTTVPDGGKVNPSAALRFSVRPGSVMACHLWLVSVVAAGQI